MNPSTASLRELHCCLLRGMPLLLECGSLRALRLVHDREAGADSGPLRDTLAFLRASTDQLEEFHLAAYSCKSPFDDLLALVRALGGDADSDPACCVLRRLELRINPEARTEIRKESCESQRRSLSLRASVRILDNSVLIWYRSLLRTSRIKVVFLLVYHRASVSFREGDGGGGLQLFL